MEGHEHFPIFRNCHSLVMSGRFMGRWKFQSDNNLIHMAVEGSVGGTTLGLHLSADTIADGGRVLWVGEEMPDNQRFSQLFQHLSLIDSSRFHAMSMSSSFDKVIDSVISALNSLPSVKLIVLDDWCSSSGRIPAEKISHVERLSTNLGNEITLLLISKSSIDASGNKAGTSFARAEKAMTNIGFSIFILSRPKDGPMRVISRDDEEIELKLTESGFIQ
jgi:replicative DNA helicase